jgi:lipid-A-disaccharide synthase
VKLFLVAGEPSGDRLGAALMAGLRQLAPEVGFAGVGGPAMAAEGLASLFPMEDLAVMGLVEVLPKYRALKRRIAQTAQAVLGSGAQALVTIDSPDFCLRVARLVRAARPRFRVIHYVAPSVWAWRPGRAATMAQVVDHVLALLPFEPPYMTAAGMSCDFVGHPVVAEPLADARQLEAFAARHGLVPPWLLVLPGSRKGEVRRLAPVFGQVLAGLAPMPVVLPTVRGVAGLVRAMVADWPVSPLIVADAADKAAAFAGARAALAASGTVSLELAANGVPMVIAYDMNPLSRVLMQRMVRVDTVTLVNLVSETRAVPEFLGARCRAELIRPALAELLADGPGRGAQAQAMALTMDRLGRGGEPPGLRAARSVLAHL